MTQAEVEELSAAFEAERVLTRAGDFLVDDATGEVVEWPAGIPEEGRTALLQASHAFACEQVDQWTQEKRAYSRALGVEFERQGVKSVYGIDHHSWSVPTVEMDGVQMYGVPAARIDEALDAEIISVEQLVLLRTMAVAAYDAKIIRALAAAKDLTPAQAKFLIVRSHRGGYTRTEPSKKVARVSQVVREAAAQ